VLIHDDPVVTAEFATVRCDWPGMTEPIYRDYHDLEWGVPLHDDRRLFELLLLEGAQAGLSWISILKRREGYRSAYFGFDAARLASLTDAVGSFDAWLWSFVGGVPTLNAWASLADVPAESDASRALSRELRRRGFSFVGPTIVYAFMQSAGLVNDHLLGCFRRDEIAALA
jgi:DNA-3-methyladenine glycosylase I